MKKILLGLLIIVFGTSCVSNENSVGRYDYSVPVKNSAILKKKGGVLSLTINVLIIQNILSPRVVINYTAE